MSRITIEYNGEDFIVEPIEGDPPLPEEKVRYLTYRISSYLGKKIKSIFDIPASPDTLAAILNALRYVPSSVAYFPCFFQFTAPLHERLKTFESLIESDYALGNDIEKVTVYIPALNAAAIKFKKTKKEEFVDFLERFYQYKDVCFTLNSKDSLFVPNFHRPEVFAPFCKESGFRPEKKTARFTLFCDSNRDVMEKVDKEEVIKKAAAWTKIPYNPDPPIKLVAASFGGKEDKVATTVNLILLKDCSIDLKEVPIILKPEVPYTVVGNTNYLHILLRLFKTLGYVTPIIGMDHKKLFKKLKLIGQVTQSPGAIIADANARLGPPDLNYAQIEEKLNYRPENNAIFVNDPILQSQLESYGLEKSLDDDKSFPLHPRNFKALSELLGRVPKLKNLPKEEVACLVIDSEV